MMHGSDPPALIAAAEEVCDALQAHADAALTRAEDVASVTDAADRLREAVLRYAERLMAETGWSNPVRHLGRLPMYTNVARRAPNAAADPSNAPRVRVAADYLVAVMDEELLGNFVEGRWADRPETMEEAIRFLFESDSWDVCQYPPRSLRLLHADIGISVTRGGVG